MAGVDKEIRNAMPWTKTFTPCACEKEKDGKTISKTSRAALQAEIHHLCRKSNRKILYTSDEEAIFAKLEEVVESLISC
jgi:hypothetical protein